jgi:hypothetical protein
VPKAPDLSAFEAANGPPNRMVCSVSVVLDQLDADRQASLRAALAEQRFQHTSIVRVLASWGHKVTSHTIARHRRGECRCEQ